jgi:phosphatidylserine synthase
MGEVTNHFSTDYYLYKFLNKLAKRICWIHPNVITIIAGLMIFPIISNILYDGDVWYLILLFLVRHILDCLDGSVARKCNKVSKFGAYLDLSFDYIFFLSIYLAIGYKSVQIKNRIMRNPFKILVILFAAVFFFILNYYFLRKFELLKDEKNVQTNVLFDFIQKNVDYEIIHFFIFALLIKFIL